MLLLYGCTTETIGSDPTEQFPDGLPIRLSTADYNNLNTYYMLNDDEPSTTICNSN